MTLCIRYIYLSLAFLIAFWSSPAALAEDRQPNVLLIMADDVGWECFSCYGAEDYRTPRIDELARDGVRFTHCYSTPICTTSRVQLMTGKYNFRNYTHFGYLDPREKTIGHLMKDAGYQTAIAGKWQLNGLANQLHGHTDSSRPHQAGFDEYMLWQLTKGKSPAQGGGERFWSPLLEHNGRMLTIEENHGKYGPDMLCDFICDFMERHQDQPFFVYYPMLLVHDPFVPTPDSIGKRGRGHESNRADRRQNKENFVAMVQYMDKIVGRLVDKLDSLGQLENTLILFTADNGTNTSITSRWNGQLIRGGKGGLKDMGTHVPLVAYWKGQTPEGQVNDSLIDFTDFYPTLARAAGVEMEQDDAVDGLSFYHQLLGQAGPQRQWVLCHYQPYWNKQPGQFARTQDYKLYRDGRFYDIGGGDLEEENNLLPNRQDEVSQPTRRFLAGVLESAPPAPKEVGTKDTVHRPTYPDWPQLLQQKR